MLHRSNMGRILLKLGVGLGILDIRNIQPNELALRTWLSLIPAAEGHETLSQAQCPAEVVSQWKFNAYYYEYTGRAVTLATDEGLEESRSHLTPFLVPLSLRDEYTVRITRALVERMKALAELHAAEFLVFAPEFTFNGVPFFSEVRCAKKDGQFYRVDSDLLKPMEAWKTSVNVEKLIIEIGHYGLESVTVDRRDPVHLNLLGNKLVMEALAKRIHSRGWLNSADASQHILHARPGLGR